MGYNPTPLIVKKITGGYKAYPPTVTSTDDLKIYANGTDTSPSIQMYGNSYLSFIGSSFAFTKNGTSGEIIVFDYSAPDVSITSNVTNSNIKLVPNGTGKIKFGDYTAGAGEAYDGYITILDAAGNTRQLACFS